MKRFQPPEIHLVRVQARATDVTRRVNRVLNVRLHLSE